MTSGGTAVSAGGFPCCDGYGEHFDTCPLTLRTTDRWGPRYLSPLGARRERSARCTRCQHPTWANDGLCDRCAISDRVRALTHLDQQAREVLLWAQP